MACIILQMPNNYPADLPALECMRASLIAGFAAPAALRRVAAGGVRAAEPPLGVPVDGRAISRATGRRPTASVESCASPTPDKPREIAGRPIWSCGARLSSRPRGVQIILADGGLIVADAVRIENEQVHGRSPVARHVRICRWSWSPASSFNRRSTAPRATSLDCAHRRAAADRPIACCWTTATS